MEDVGEEVGVDAPAEGGSGLVRVEEGGVRGQVLDKDGQPPERQLAAPQVREVDAVEAKEVGFYGVALRAEEGGEPQRFPASPSASARAWKRSVRSATRVWVSRKRS